MSGNRKCKTKICDVRIPSNQQFCEDHTQASEDYVDQLDVMVKAAGQEIMKNHVGTFQKLAAHEAAEKVLVKNQINVPNGLYPMGGTKHDNEKSYLTLPTNSDERKQYPLLRGCLRYFPAALAGVAHISKLGNDKHNPGEELHHARGKSMDHGDCLLRHLVDLQDLLATLDKGQGSVALIRQAREEVSCLAWRALAYSQELHERFGSPLAPGAKVE